MPLTIDFPSKSAAEQYCALTNAQEVEIIPNKIGATVHFKNAPLIESLKAGQFELAQQQHGQLTVVEIPGLAQPLIAKVTIKTFEGALEWGKTSDTDEFPKLQNLVFENCKLKGLSFFKNSSIYIGCEFTDCRILGRKLVVAREGFPKENFDKCSFVDCGICGEETFPSDTYNKVIRYYVGKGKPLISPSCTFNACEFGAIFERRIDFSNSLFIDCKVCSKFTPHGIHIFPDKGVTAAVQEFYPDSEDLDFTEWKGSDFYPDFNDARDRADEWTEENPEGDAMGGQPDWVSGVQNLLSESE